MILVTGGAGYIGTHVCIMLQASGYEIVVLDNFSNSSEKALKRVEKISGQKIFVEKGDVRDISLLKLIFQKYKVNGVIHLAGLKSVSESCEQPLTYFDHNVCGTLALLRVMSETDVKQLVFSSSATVYGNAHKSPLVETMSLGTASNPYGESKAQIERILEYLCASDNDWAITSLRYFNPVGAHESGQIGESPSGVPNNLMPYITQVALGKLESLSVFGSDYDTPDGTCLRDYIHVMDLAEGHLSAIRNMCKGYRAINLGTGQPVSVKEIIETFKRVNSVNVEYNIAARRKGDISSVWADVTLAKKSLGWVAKYNLEEMVRDSWNWQCKNPNGY